MALTKAEAKRIADLEEGIRLARSMRWPEYNMPAPMTQAEIKAALVPGGMRYGSPQMVARGWFGFGRSDGSYHVSYGCSDGVNHNSDGDTTIAQNMGRMFATELDAWRAARYQLTERFAKSLAAIDEKIAELSS
jgi:hypothetical protein